MKHYLPFSLTLIRGAIGKEFVIKHYRYGIIKTKFPDMTRIIASLEQRKCRDLFKKAVAYAQEVIADGQRKRDWQKRLRRWNGVYNEAIKFYMLKDKRAKEAAMLEAKRLIRRAFAQSQTRSLFDEAGPKDSKYLYQKAINIVMLNGDDGKPPYKKVGEILAHRNPFPSGGES